MVLGIVLTIVVVLLAPRVLKSDGDGFLPNIKMEESADLLRLVGAEAALLETPDPHHLAM